MRLINTTKIRANLAGIISLANTVALVLVMFWPPASPYATWAFIFAILSLTLAARVDFHIARDVEDIQHEFRLLRRELKKHLMHLNDFPLNAIKHLAGCGCQCQRNGNDVRCNAHLKACMVGQSQQYLGMHVTWRDL